jgi:hypothetical protein
LRRRAKPDVAKGDVVVWREASRSPLALLLVGRDRSPAPLKRSPAETATYVFVLLGSSAGLT